MSNKPELPHDEAAERTLLAICMNNTEGDYAAFDSAIAHGVSLDSFYVWKHRLLWALIFKQRSEGRLIDESHLHSAMQDIQVGSLPGFERDHQKEKKASACIDISFLVDLANEYSAFPLNSFVLTLKDKELLRATVSCGERLVQAGMLGTMNGDEAKGVAEAELLNLTGKTTARDTSTIAYDAIQKRIQELIEGTNDKPRYKIGFPFIDGQIGGVPKGHNIVIGARPSTGKTSLCLQICSNLCSAGLRGVFFSMESPKQQIIDRLIAYHANEPIKRIEEGIADRRALRKKSATFPKGLLIDDGRGRTVFDIRSLARRYKQTHGVDFVACDHFGRIRTTRTGDRSAIEEISTELDDMKHELDCIVITLAQFNRTSERERRKPMMSDLRECGRLEEDADTILLLSRIFDDNGDSIEDKRHIYCPKNRDGQAAWGHELLFNGPTYRFKDPSTRMCEVPVEEMEFQ